MPAVYGRGPEPTRYLLALTVLATILFAIAIRSLPLYADEGNLGPYAKCVLKTGDWLTIRAGPECLVVFSKGPLFFWALAASLRIGGMSEVALRMPNLIASIVIVVLTYHLVLTATGNALSAFVSGLVLLTIEQFVYHQRYAITDPLMVMILMLGAAAYLQALDRPRWLFAVGFVVFFAMLVKPIFPVLVLPIIVIHLVLTRRLTFLRRPYLYWGLIAGAVPFALWNAYEVWRFSATFMWEYWGLGFWGTGPEDPGILRPGERALRWATTITPQYFDHAYHWDTPWFYVMWLGLFCQPWVALVPQVVRDAFRAKDIRRDVGWLAIVWVVVTVIALTSMRWRSQHYLLMVYPMVAVAIGALALPSLVDRQQRTDRWSLVLLGALFAFKVGQLTYGYLRPGTNLPAGWRFEWMLTALCLLAFVAYLGRPAFGTKLILACTVAMWLTTTVVYGSLAVRPQQPTDLQDLRTYVQSRQRPVVVFAPAEWFTTWDLNPLWWYFDGLKVCRTLDCLNGLTRDEPIVLSTESEGLEALQSGRMTLVQRNSFGFKLDVGQLQLETAERAKRSVIAIHRLYVFEFIDKRAQSGRKH